MAFILDTEKISALAVELLARTLVLPATVSRVPGEDYRGTGGTTVVRVPQRRTALEQENPGDSITLTAIDEVPVTVDLKHLYDAARLSDEDLTLGIENFGRQVLQPMIAAVAEGGEDVLANVMDGVTPSFDFTDLTDPEATEGDVLLARETLTSADVPAGGRFLAVAPDVATTMLRLDKFSKVNESGSPSALRDATLGTIYGMTVVESSALEASSAVAYHRSGFAFATLAPSIPRGAGSAAVANAQGVALRVVYDYSIQILSDAIAVSTFGGAATVDTDRIVRIGSAS
jgi:hypothetical protein